MSYVPVFDMQLLLTEDKNEFQYFSKNIFGPQTHANGFCRWTLTPEIKALEDAHFEKAKLFHALDENIKEGFKSNEEQIGYKGLKTEAIRRKEGSTPDLKTYFMLEQGLGPCFNEVSQEVLDVQVNGKTVDDYVPGYSQTIMDLMLAREKIAGRITQAVALFLELPNDSFSHFLESGHFAQRDLYYPPCTDATKGAMRIDTHQDRGLVTLLRAENGIEIQDGDGEWHKLETAPGEWISNGGLQMEILTNGNYRAAYHRVALPDSQEERSKPRYANPWFGGVNRLSILSPFNALIERDGQNNFPYTIREEALRMMGTRGYTEDNAKLKQKLARQALRL